MYSFNGFCLCLPAFHRSLHSFPTRRSSDLVCLEVSTAEWVCSWSSRSVRVTVEDAPLLAASASSRSRDRKSTRLNSSHGYISYAVFCLKKKRTPAEESIRAENFGMRLRFTD